MKRNNYIHIILSFVVLALFACTNENELLQGDGKEITVTYHPVIETTRAIGDATNIDQLVVGVYENGSKKYITKFDWATAQSNGISIVLIEGRQYNIIFWAQNSSNRAYTLTDGGKISVNYEDYLNGGFAKMEKMDAFYAVSNMSVGSNNATAEVILTRPFAQINFADNTTQPVTGEHVAVLTLSGIATEFDPINGTITTAIEDKTFTFSDFPDEPLSVDGNTYYYITNNYLFTPVGTTASINATLDLQKADGSSIKQIELQGVILEKNKKTNVLGAIVQQPEQWSVWDGKTATELTTDAENRYVIKSAANVAWLAQNASTLSAGTFVLTTDIDMNDGALEPISLPAGSTIDGDEHTIKNLKLSGALFSDATSLTINNLILDGITVGNQGKALTHAGVLVNTLKGSSSFANVSVTNSSVTTIEGAAGGMVGYIERNSAKDRNETLNVTFTGCKLNGVTVKGSASEGKFVGLLSGYDNNESLTFDAECEATDVSVADYASTYTKANNSEWAGTIDTRYNGWLGAETYRRAKVTFGGVRMAPRWDGKTVTAKADLLLYNGESNKYEVHSPFDLAGVRNATASPAALYLMENVDMYGQGADGKYNVPSNWTQSAYVSEDDNYFKSFSTITYLDGNNNGIYNLNINTQKVSTSLYYGGFIQSSSGTTTHKNIKFYSSCVVVPKVVYKNEDKGSAGMLISNIAGDSYTMDNVHTYGCKIFALQKVGGIAARVAATNSNIKNSSVNNCYIENYKCEDNLETFSGGNDLASVSASFYSYGEIGGMFGFVEMNTTIDNCKVNGTTIYAYGQDDKAATKSGLAFILSKYYTVPGRHVGTFIGDIRTTTSGGGTITMTNISVDSSTKCTNRWDKHNNKCETVGRAYFLYLKDDEGTVKYNGTKLTLQNCKNNQNRNQ